jgi:hypothetical protein
VSHIEKITGDLRAMATGVDSARANAAAADSKAQEIAVRAAGSGFAGIAANMSRVRDAIGEVQASLTGTGRTIAEAASAVAAVPKETSPDQAVAVLSPVQEKIGGIRDGVTATVAKVEDAKRRAVVALRGGQPGAMVSALDAVARVLLLVAQRAGTAKQHIETAVREARHVGGSGN